MPTLIKLVFNIVKWTMIIVAIHILTNTSSKVGQMAARSESRMAEVIISPKANGFLSLYDNYQYKEFCEIEEKTVNKI